MTRKPAVKLKLVNADQNDSEPKPIRDPRSLAPLDWYAAGILCALMIVAPLVAGDFATSSGVLPIDSVWSVFSAIGVPLALIMAAIAYLPFAWREWSKPVAIGSVPGLAPAFTLLVIWTAISAIRTPAMYLTVNAVAVLCGVVISAGIISRLARDRNAVVALLVSISIGGTIVAIIGISEYIGYVRLHVPEHRSFSTFSDPNFLAGYLLLTIPVALSLFACSDDLRLRCFAAVSVVAQSSALWLSGSRSGSAIVLVEVGVFVFLAMFVRASAKTTRWLRVGIALFVIGSLPAVTPLLSRLTHKAPVVKSQTHSASGVVSNDAQVNSNEFRRWTWIGTVRMALANPVVGTGFGAFELSYARYAETAFTAHAHNSYLQLMSETGYPGVLLVLIGLAAAAAFAAHSLLLKRNRAAVTNSDGATNRSDDDSFHPLLRSSDVLQAGLLAAIAGSMLHGLIDSDWYVAANAFTLGAILALAVAIARDMAPLSTRRPAPLGKDLIAAAAVIAILLLWRGGELASARMSDSLGATDVDIMASPTSSPDVVQLNRTQATEAYREAAAADPLDPEPHLRLAELASSKDDALKELNTALGICKTGKGYYNLGQYYMGMSQWDLACEAFDHARSLQPKMLQNLRALAGAYLAAGKIDLEERTLNTMTALQFTPYGQVRAMHESVETDFGYAHAMLGDIDAKRGDWAGAAPQYEQARDVLQEYWVGRHYLVNTQTRTEAKRKDFASLFEAVLQQLEGAYVRLNRPADARTAADKLVSIRKDRESDEAAAGADTRESSPSK